VPVSVADVRGRRIGEGRRGHDLQFLKIHDADMIADGVLDCKK
jgi:hypothetical protein